MNARKTWIGALVFAGAGALLVPQSAQAWYLASSTTADGYDTYADDGYIGFTNGYYDTLGGVDTAVEAECETWDEAGWAGTGRPAQTTNAAISANVSRTIWVQGSPSPGPSSTVSLVFHCGQQLAFAEGDEQSPSVPANSGIVKSYGTARSHFTVTNSSDEYEWIASTSAKLYLFENPAENERWETATFYGSPPESTTNSSGSVSAARPFSKFLNYNGFSFTETWSAQGFSAQLVLYATAKAWYDYDATGAKGEAWDASWFNATVAVP